MLSRGHLFDSLPPPASSKRPLRPSLKTDMRSALTFIQARPQNQNHHRPLLAQFSSASLCCHNSYLKRHRQEIFVFCWPWRILSNVAKRAFFPECFWEKPVGEMPSHCGYHGISNIFPGCAPHVACRFALNGLASVIFFLGLYVGCKVREIKKAAGRATFC